MSINSIALKNPYQPSEAAKVVSGYASVAMSTITAAALGGASGAAIGLTSAVADQLLQHYGVTSKNYLSNAAFWGLSVINPLSGLACTYLPKSACTAFNIVNWLGLGLALPYYTNDAFDFSSKLERPLEAFAKVNCLFDEEQEITIDRIKSVFRKFSESPFYNYVLVKELIKDIAQNPLMVSFIKQMGFSMLISVVNFAALNFIADYNATPIMLEFYQKHGSILELFKQGKALSEKQYQAVYESVQPVLIKGIQVLIALILKNQIVWRLRSSKNMESKELSKKVSEKCNHFVLHSKSAVDLMSQDGGKQVLYNLASDFKALTDEGPKRIVEVVSASTNAVLAMQTVARIVKTGFIPYILSLIPYQRFLASSAKEQAKIQKELAGANTDFQIVKNDIIQNIYPIDLRDGEDFIEEQYEDLSLKTHVIESKVDALKRAHDIYSKNLELLNDLIHYANMGFHIVTLQLDLSGYPAALRALKVFYEFVMSGAKTQHETSSLGVMHDRAEKFINTLSASAQPKLERTTNDAHVIRLKDYQLSIKDKQIVYVDELSIELGYCYAVTGKSGCGKSSFLKDLKLGVFGGLSSKGEISLPQELGEQDFMFLDQDLYFPKLCTLFEVAVFPQKRSDFTEGELQEKRKLVLQLFEELEIDQDCAHETCHLATLLDSQEFSLSGGQSKKMALIAAILKQPKILVMDETFTGLDKRSLYLAQKAVQKYLRGATILVVDHHADDNNQNGFYQRKVHFSDGSVRVCAC